MKRALRSLLWPRYTAVDPNIVNRIGRVLHWALVFLIAPITAAMVSGTMDKHILLAAVLAFLSVALVGRAVRYILSAE